MNRKELLKKLGINVKIVRIKKELTQEKLAEKIGVSQNYIASIECGKANMSIAKILELADYLEVDISMLLLFKE